MLFVQKYGFMTELRKIPNGIYEFLRILYHLGYNILTKWLKNSITHPKGKRVHLYINELVYQYQKI